ncbi:DUF2156 domain-containing protein [Candidatus Woesearchaeota archaeon]|nr:DUF2156 domain-containing protein [Candidatus Woesearchaeota archaeon]
MGEFITDFDKNRGLIEKFISEKGFSCDHNYWHNKNMEENGIKPVFYKDNEGNGIFSLYYEDDNDYEQLSDALPKEKTKEIIYEFAEFIFNKGANKFFISTAPELRKEIQKEKRFKVSKILRSFESPVFNLNNFDDSLPGKDWKKVRNHINNLIKNHKIEVKDCRTIDKQLLLNLVNEWSKTRKSHVSKAWRPYFENFVKNGFHGCKITRCVLVDDEPCSIAAGWEIPNSNIYYSSIGIHNYKYNGIGEFAYIDELKELKRNGYTLIDLGGSEKRFFDFKKKFQPEKTYSVVFYWIKRK